MNKVKTVYYIARCYESGYGNESIILGVTDSKSKFDEIMNIITKAQKKCRAKLELRNTCFTDLDFIKNEEFFTEEEKETLNWLEGDWKEGNFVSNFYWLAQACFDSGESKMLWTGCKGINNE